MYIISFYLINCQETISKLILFLSTEKKLYFVLLYIKIACTKINCIQTFVLCWIRGRLRATDGDVHTSTSLGRSEQSVRLTKFVITSFHIFLISENKA